MRRLNHPGKHYTFAPKFSPSGNQIVYVVAGRADDRAPGTQDNRRRRAQADHPGHPARHRPVRARARRSQRRPGGA